MKKEHMIIAFVLFIVVAIALIGLPSEKITGGAWQWDLGSRSCTDTDDPNKEFPYPDNPSSYGYNTRLKGTCTDSGGRTSTDRCTVPNKMLEFFCYAGTCYPTQKECPNGCENGACIEAEPESTCIDTDGGKDYYVRGKTYDNKKYFENDPLIDNCLDSTSLDEYYCREDGYAENVKYNCPKGCKDGACIEGNTACIWMDRYGSQEIEHKLVNEVCPGGYKDVAYELRRDHWLYSDSYCSDIIFMSGDHQILESYGITVPKIGVPVGNKPECRETGAGFYTRTHQHYDGVLCCST